MSSKRARRALRDAHRLRALVVVRRHKHWGVIEGYVAGIGQKWLALSMLDSHVRPDGLVLLRVRDVRRVRNVTGGERLKRRSLVHHNLWPPASTSPNRLNRTRDLVRELTGDHRLLSVFIEREDPDACFIGPAVEVRRKHVWLHEIDPNARWEDELTRVSFGDITRIDVGDGYQATLLGVGGPPPVIKRRKRSR